MIEGGLLAAWLVIYVGCIVAAMAILIVVMIWSAYHE